MRTNTKTSSKFYDEMTANDWTLRFEYETENGQLIDGKVMVQGTKGNTSLTMFKQATQTQTIFSNGDFDAEIVVVAQAEINAIVAALAPVEKEG